MIIQWFPGHMAKTRRVISEHLKLVDVAGTVDVISQFSRNPEIDSILRINPELALNKVTYLIRTK